MPAVTEHQFEGGTMWSYDDVLYDKYEDIPFKTKEQYEAVKSKVGTAAKATWDTIGKIPHAQGLLKDVATGIGKGVQYIDQVQPENPLYGLNVALDTLKFADEKLTQGSEFLEKQTGIYAPTTKVVSELAIDYLASGGAGKIAKGSKMLANQGDNLVRKLTPQLAYETVPVEGLFTSAVRDATSPGFKPSNMFAATTIRNIPKTLIGKTEGYLKKAGRTKEAITHNLQLKTQMGEWFEQNADALLKGNLDRGAFGKIVDSDGVRQDVLGLNKYLNSVKAGKPDPSLITFNSSKTRHLKNTKRLERMRAPTGGLERLARKLFPEDPALAKNLVEEYRIDAGRGFKRVQDAAKKNTALGDPSDAGHWFSTKSSTGPNPLDRAPTSGQSARIENRIKNRKGGAKVEHDINPYAAQKAGLPRNWEEDFLYYLDRKYQKGNVIDWKAEYGNEALEMIESIPYNASKAEVDKVFNEINAMMKPRHEQIGKHLEDFKLDQKYSELSEYTPD